jgi:glycosyltransferase involved in cell wall biosynthesis
MNVCMIVLNNFGNDARVYKEAKTLAVEGHTVTVLALKDESVAATEEMDGFRVVRVQLSTRRWGLGIIARGIKLLEYLVRTFYQAWRTQADVYHAHDANTLFVAWLASRLWRVPLIYDSHEFERGRNWRNSNLPVVFRRLWNLPERLFVRSADLVITVSNSIADELSRIYRIDRPTVILNCPESAAHRVSNRLRDELSILPDQRIALYQGGVAEGVGLYSFIEGALRVPDLTAVILGSGPLLESLREWVQNNDWSERVRFPGRVPLSELADYTASAEVGVALIQNVCLSYYYSLPNKLFEYIQAGLPIIASDFPEMRRIVQQHQVGMVVDPESPQAVAQGLRTVLDDPDQWARMRVNVRNASKVYNWENESRKLVEAYCQLDPSKE